MMSLVSFANRHSIDVISTLIMLNLLLGSKIQSSFSSFLIRRTRRPFRRPRRRSSPRTEGSEDRHRSFPLRDGLGIGQIELEDACILQFKGANLSHKIPFHNFHSKGKSCFLKINFLITNCVWFDLSVSESDT